MARIAGVDLPRRKHIVHALPYIYGIGLTTSKRLCATANLRRPAAQVRPALRVQAFQIHVRERSVDG